MTLFYSKKSQRPERKTFQVKLETRQITWSRGADKIEGSSKCAPLPGARRARGGGGGLRGSRAPRAAAEERLGQTFGLSPPHPVGPAPASARVVTGGGGHPGPQSPDRTPPPPAGGACSRLFAQRPKNPSGLETSEAGVWSPTARERCRPRRREPRQRAPCQPQNRGQTRCAPFLRKEQPPRNSGPLAGLILGTEPLGSLGRT